MDLLDEIRLHVQSYVDGRCTLDQLQERLADRAETVAASDDDRIRRLDGRAWTLISEYGYGHRSEDSVRADLSAELRADVPAAAGVSQPT
jgi:hypothetical protein